MIKEIQVRIVPEEAANEQSLKRVASRETAVAVNRIQAVRMLKRSIDARQRTIFVNLKLRLFIDTWLTYFATKFRSTSRLRIVRRICLPYFYLACTGFSISGLCFPHASPQFCLYAVQEFKPVVHRIRLATSP